MHDCNCDDPYFVGSDIGLVDFAAWHFAEQNGLSGGSVLACQCGAGQSWGCRVLVADCW